MERVEIVVYSKDTPRTKEFETILDELGRKSAIAQNLSKPITTIDLFNQNTQDQKLYIALINKQPIGFIKTGQKHLFYVTRQGEYIELDPLCVLDFYVEETFQRRGIGLALFSNLLETFHSSGNSPQDFAYDRPSPKLIAFLKKHYQLIDHFPQPNNFLIFDAFFKSNLQAKVLKANNKETRQKENR